MPKFLRLSAFVFILTACSTLPSGPSVLVLPGTGKDFGQFKTDDNQCRQLAFQQIAPGGKQPDSRDDGQQGYDIVYIQCMYGKGHRVPVPAELSYDTRQQWHSPPPPDLPAPPEAADVAPTKLPVNPSH